MSAGSARGGSAETAVSADAAPTLVLLPGPPGSEAYLALDKPSGRVVHGPAGLLAEMRRVFGGNSPEGALALVHRLDRETSGVLLFARGPEALRRAHAAWPRNVEKTYRAVTRGAPEPPAGIVTLPLLENRTSRPELLRRALTAAYGGERAARLLEGERLPDIPPLPPPGRTAVHPAGRPATTEYRVLRTDGEAALVELAPRTGRMHQLRVHLAALGTPIRYDASYDPARSPGDPPPYLNAWRLVWRDPPGSAAGEPWVFTSAATPPGAFGR